MDLPAASKGKDGFALSRIFWKTAGELHTFAVAFPIHTCSALFTRSLPARSYTGISSSVTKYLAA